MGGRGVDIHDGREGANGVGHIIGAVGKTEQGGGKNEGQSEEGIHAFFAAHQVGLTADAEAGNQVGQYTNAKTDQCGSQEVYFPDTVKAFKNDVGAERPAHQRDQPRHNAVGRRQHVWLIGDAALY